MPDTGNFGANRPAGKASTGQLDCAAVEQWLAESAETALPGTVAEALRAHTAQCAACDEKLEQTARGREWLLLLKKEALAPPADLLAKILARTSQARTSPLEIADQDGLPTPGRAPHSERGGLAASASAEEFPGEFSRRAFSRGARDDRGPAPVEDSTSIWQHSSVVLLRRTLLEPRLALVAAMAFFSISLTLNLMGVRVTQLRPADFTPSNMSHAISHQYVETNARVVRYYENLRIVYEVEARVQQLRRAAETNPPAQQEPTPQKNRSGSSGNSGFLHPRSRQDRMANGPKTPGAGRPMPVPVPIVAGPVMDARLHAPADALPVTKTGSPADEPAGSIERRARVPADIDAVRTVSFHAGLFENRSQTGRRDAPGHTQPAPASLFALPATPCSRSSICLLHRTISTQERRLV